MDDETHLDEAPDAATDEPPDSSRGASLRWLPAGLSGFCGVNLMFLGASTAIQLAGRFREQGWRAFGGSSSPQALSLVMACLGVLLFFLSGVAALLASSSWMGRRWSRAVLLSLSLIILLVTGAFLLGHSRVDLKPSP